MIVDQPARIFLFSLFIGLVYSGEICPPSEDISPCRCTESSDTPIITTLDCSSAKSVDDIERASQAEYGSNLLTKFYIDRNYKVQELDGNVFGSLAFQVIEMKFMNITLLTPDFFENSLDTLQNLIITEATLYSFPFELFSVTTELKEVTLYLNRITHLPKLTCQSPIHTLNLASNLIERIEDETFDFCQDLEEIVLNSNSITELSASKKIIVSVLHEVRKIFQTF